VMAVLLGKEFVLQARRSAGTRGANAPSTIEEDSESVREELDKTAFKIITRCGSKHNHRSPGSLSNYSLPPELSSLPRKIFMLRKGPMLGPILQHADDIDYVRCLFLNADFDVCNRLIEPALWMAIDREEKFYQVPAEDLALQSDKVLLLDAHTDIFIWIGSSLSVDDEENSSRQRNNLTTLALESARHRFPKPQILQFKEGSSMARWLQCRLVPSHKDSPEEQNLCFPQLDELTAENRAKLMAKFHRTDDLSYNQYFRKLLQR